MNINRDNFENITIPDFILKKASGDRVGIVPCIAKTYDRKFNEPDEIQFTTLLFQDGEKNELYEDIEVMKYIEVYGIGLFLITSVNESSEGTEHASKDVTGKSCEITLGQKYLNEFYINTGETGAIDGVQFYNIADHDHSLLHLVIGEKFPEWTIGHVDTILESVHRSFTVDSQDVYSFLMEDVATAFECFFIFDSLNRIINVYAVDNYGEDTNVSVSYNNLLKNTELTCDVDSIKTALTITGEDELTVREVAMGFETIYNFDYYNSLNFWSQSLYDAYNAWVELYNSQVDDYTVLLQQYEEYYDQINEMQSTRMPEVDNYLEWVNMTELEAKGYMQGYSYNFLYEKKQAYEQKQAAYMKMGYGEVSSSYYTSLYVPVYNVLGWIDDVLHSKQIEINLVKEAQYLVGAQMEAIINLVSMQNNFTPAQLKELSVFIREDTLSSDNYVVTDTMTTEEKYDMLNDMITFARKELAKISVPQLSFTAGILNLFAMPEFDTYSGDFDIGNYIWVTLRDDFSIKAKLLSIHIDYFDKNNFTVTFGNVVRKADNIFTDITEAVNTATSVATSVSFNSSYWSESSKQANSITQMIDEGLLAAGAVLTDGSSSEIVFDKRGLFINSNDFMDDGVTPNPYAEDSIFLGGGRMLFTDDDWQTVSEAVGRIEINGNSTFGVIAKALVAGLIMGSTIYGSKIYLGNDQGTYEDESGELICYGSWSLGSGTYTNYDRWYWVDSSTVSVPGEVTVNINISNISDPSSYYGMYEIRYTEDDRVTWTTIETGPLYEGDNAIQTVLDVKESLNYRYLVYIKRYDSSYTSTFRYQITLNSLITKIDKNGISTSHIYATSGTFKGQIKALSGYIGEANTGWQIASTSIYNGPNSIQSLTTPGTYVGTNGFLNVSSTDTSKYTQITNGKITSNNADITGTIKATSGEIAQWKINTASQGGLYYGTDDAWVRPDLIACGTHGSCLIAMRPGSGYLSVEVNTWTDYIHILTNSIEKHDDNTGTMYAYWWNGSDERIKEDIKPLSIEEAQLIINNTEPLSFRYIEEKNKIKHYGFTAQRIEKECEDLGLENPFVRYGEMRDDLKNVDYMQFIAPLVKVVQSQQQEITELKDEINSLKSELDEIKKLLRKGGEE